MGIDDWVAAIEKIAAVCAQSQAEGALCTIICTDYNDVKTRRRVLVSKLVEKAFECVGYDLFDVAYAPRHVQQNQNPGMGALTNLAKQNRTPLTDMALDITFIRAG